MPNDHNVAPVQKLETGIPVLLRNVVGVLSGNITHPTENGRFVHTQNVHHREDGHPPDGYVAA